MFAIKIGYGKSELIDTDTGIVHARVHYDRMQSGFNTRDYLRGISTAEMAAAVEMNLETTLPDALPVYVGSQVTSCWIRDSAAPYGWRRIQ